MFQHKEEITPNGIVCIFQSQLHLRKTENQNACGSVTLTLFRKRMIKSKKN